MSAHQSTEFSRLRTRAGVSIDDLVVQSGFSRRTLYRWENGEARPRLAAMQLLKSMLREERSPYVVDGYDAGPRFSFIDLFAGIGGLPGR